MGDIEYPDSLMEKFATCLEQIVNVKGAGSWQEKCEALKRGLEKQNADSNFDEILEWFSE